MKDPLRYFLDEGFGHIYSFRNESGHLNARIRWVRDYEDFIPSLVTRDGHTIALIIGGVSYITNDDFMEKYTIRVESQEVAENLSKEEDDDWVFVKEVTKELC